MNLEFFTLLCESRDFCEAMGRMTLTAGRVESELKHFFKLTTGKEAPAKATMGKLVQLMRAEGLLSENGERAMQRNIEQRNYFIHSLFDLFSGRVDETLFPRSDHADVDVFVEYAGILDHNLCRLSEIVQARISHVTSAAPTDGPGRLLL